MTENAMICSTLPVGATMCPAGHAPIDRAITVAGRPGVIYEVLIRFRGLVEPRAYVGGTPIGDHFRIGGAAQAGSGFNVYALRVSAPRQEYFLNDSGGPMDLALFPLDHLKRIPVEGGATVRLRLEDPDCRAVRNCDAVPPAPCRPQVVPGVPPAPSPFDGQFLQMDVIDVVARAAAPGG
jgi:hypothetical protein